MNDWLAQFYGTAPAVETPDDTNMNKTASVALLEKVAEEIGADFDGIDIDALSEEDAEELLEELFSQMGDETDPEPENAETTETPEAATETKDETPEPEAAAETEGDGELDKESMAKLAEADFYGRAMAHAYVDELRQLEKAAENKDDARARLKAALMGGKGGPLASDAPPKESKDEPKCEKCGDKGCPACKKEDEEKTSSVLDSAIDNMAVDLANKWIEEHGLQKRAVSEDVQTAVQQRAVELLIQEGYVDPSDLG